MYQTPPRNSHRRNRSQTTRTPPPSDKPQCPHCYRNFHSMSQTATHERTCIKNPLRQSLTKNLNSNKSVTPRDAPLSVSGAPGGPSTPLHNHPQHQPRAKTPLGKVGGPSARPPQTAPMTRQMSPAILYAKKKKEGQVCPLCKAPRSSSTQKSCNTCGSTFRVASPPKPPSQSNNGNGNGLSQSMRPTSSSSRAGTSSSSLGGSARHRSRTPSSRDSPGRKSQDKRLSSSARSRSTGRGVSSRNSTRSSGGRAKSVSRSARSASSSKKGGDSTPTSSKARGRGRSPKPRGRGRSPARASSPPYAATDSYDNGTSGPFRASESFSGRGHYGDEYEDDDDLEEAEDVFGSPHYLSSTTATPPRVHGPSQAMFRRAQTLTEPVDRLVRRREVAASPNGSARVRNSPGHRRASTQQVDMNSRDLRSMSIADKASLIADKNRVQCPHCTRTFSLQASARHIEVCANVKSKPRRIERGNTKLAYMRT